MPATELQKGSHLSQGHEPVKTESVSSPHIWTPQPFIYLYLAALGLQCCLGFSLVPPREGYSLVAAHGFFTVVASLVVEPRL